MKELEIHVLIQFNKKSGKVITIMTSLGDGLLIMYALNRTPKTMQTVIFNRNTGKCVFNVEGSEEGPCIVKELSQPMMCTDFGIPLEVLQEIKDERFDKE